MKLGIEIDWQSRHFRVPVERVQLADRLGYDMCFTAESQGNDAFTPLGFVLGITSNIGVGTHIAQTVGRSIPNLAMSYQTLSAMAKGREVVAGLGSSAALRAEGWHGEPWTKPYRRMRELIPLMKTIFRGETVTADGEIYRIPWHEPGAAPQFPPSRPIMETNPDIPIMFGGGSELMLTLAAEIADGWMPMSYAPGMMKVYRPIIEKGLARRSDGKRFEDFPIWSHVDVMITDDVGSAMKEFKYYTARWAGGWHPGQPNAYGQQMIWRGFGDALPRIQELWHAGRQEEAAAAVPDEFIDEGWLLGPLPRIIERWKSRWIDCGVNLIVRTDNWPNATPSGNEAFEPLLKALRG
jgi:alkanesulfonate monooxygenase SsuD/methylene tetrahydromethanopterin reductase-like flavin-dependent oxidoreductase (luciferase family)